MSNLSEIDVAILAGGLGTRLASILPEQQKVISKVREHPFLEYILNQMDEAGFKNIIICTGYLGDQVQKIFGNQYRGLTLSYSRELSPLGTAGAIRLALPFLNSENILITNGDSFYDTNLNKFWQFHLEKKATGTIILKEVSDTSRYGKVEVDKKDKIIKFQEKNKTGGIGFINGGLYLFKRAKLLEIPGKKIISFEKDIFPNWIGKDLYGFKGQGNFIDIGTPKSYKEAQKFFSEYIK